MVTPLGFIIIYLASYSNKIYSPTLPCLDYEALTLLLRDHYLETRDSHTGMTGSGRLSWTASSPRIPPAVKLHQPPADSSLIFSWGISYFTDLPNRLQVSFKEQ